jgi:hypothetical protein
MICEQANHKRLASFFVTVAVFVAVVRNVAISALPFASLSRPYQPVGLANVPLRSVTVRGN